MTERLCPVCWQHVTETPLSGLVAVHHDKGFGRCPMSGKPFYWCYPPAVDPKLRGVS